MQVVRLSPGWGQKQKKTTAVTARGFRRGGREMFCLFSAEMTLAPVTFSTTSHQSVLFFILPGYTSASEIRDLLVPGSPDSTFSSILLQGAIRICPQNTRGERGHRGAGERLSLLWMRHLQIKTFVPLSPQSPVVHAH